MNSTSKRNKRKGARGKVAAVCATAAVCAGAAYFFFFTAMARDGERYIYIDGDDTADSVMSKVARVSTPHSAAAMRMLSAATGYGDNVREGRYTIGGEGALATFRNLRNGRQAAIRLTVRSVRTPEDMAEDVCKKMPFKKSELLKAMTDSATCAKYGYTPETIMCMFVPETYDIYWNTGVSGFLERMKKECDKFWNEERKEKARKAGLTPEEVTTIASIVAEETNDAGEKPTIAGIYINRLRTGMALQSCPTVKFAMKRFDLKRLYTSMLAYDSPYNTYKYKGLPPGPIRNPNIEDIDAVLDYKHHKYMYMCAKADFSGTHDFAETYEEHLENSKRYDAELDKREIR